MDSSGSKMKRSDLLGGYMSNSDHSSYSKLKSHDSGYYDGSYYKSKYDDLLSDVTSSRHTPRTVAAYTGSSTSRQLKPYKRTDSDTRHRTAINLYELLDGDESIQQQQPQPSYRRQYSKGKSAGKGMTTSTSSRYIDTSSTDDSSDDFSEIEKTERENRRKEIQNLIMKYAQLDDFYGKSSTSKKDDNNNESVKLDPWDQKAKSPVVIPSKKQTTKPASSSTTNGFNALGKSQTMASIAPHHYQSNYDSFDYDPSWYENSYNRTRSKGGNVVPITTYAPKSSSKSRMSKALSTFVRAKRNIRRLKCCNKKSIFCVVAFG